MPGFKAYAIWFLQAFLRFELSFCGLKKPFSNVIHRSLVCALPGPLPQVINSREKDPIVMMLRLGKGGMYDGNLDSYAWSQ